MATAKQIKAEAALQRKKVWVIAYIDPEHLSKVKKQLTSFDGIKAYIPTVKVLRKQFKGKSQFKRIPLLFNYGFFKIPFVMANNPEFMDSLKKRVTAIQGWAKDTSQVEIGGKHIDRARVAPVAFATKEEIKRLVENTKKHRIYNKKDIRNATPGQLVTLKWYPFDGMQATIISVDKKKKKVSVEIMVAGKGLNKKIEVDFANVFYSVYDSDYVDEPGNHVDIDSVYIKDTQFVDAIDL